MEVSNIYDSQAAVQEQSFIRRVYNWMAAGLGLTAVVSFYILTNRPILLAILQSQFLLFGLMIGELILVFWLARNIPSMSTTQATVMFFVYAAMNGITLTPLLVLYTSGSLFQAFLVTGGMFAAASFYGYTTKKSLASLGGYLFMALVGGIIAILVNGFLIKSSALDWGLSILMIGLAIGITAYHTQSIKQMSHGLMGDEEMASRGAIAGALSLYVTFVMMFVYVLRFMGHRR